MSAGAGRVTVATLRAKKAAGERIAMLTATDYSLARMCDCSPISS